MSGNVGAPIIRDGYLHSVAPFRGRDRFAYWCDVVSNEYVKLDCDAMTENNTRRFEGELRGGVGVGDVRFSEVLAGPQLVRRNRRQIARAREDSFLISFQVARHCVVRQAGREAVLTPGSFALYDSTAAYSLSFAEPFHQFVLQMPREVLCRHLIEPEKYAAIAISARSGLGSVLQNFIFSLAQELAASDRGPNEVLSENLVNLIALSLSSTVVNSHLMESETARDALIHRILQFIEANLFDARLNNTKIAESQGISVRYLNKLFQEREESVRELILRQRLEAARDLLAAGDQLTVEQVAYHVGFSGAPHFSRAFKARFGLCPSEIG